MNQDSRFEPVTDTFVPVSSDTINQLESSVKAHLPTAYVRFLSEYGGCGFSGDALVKAGSHLLPILAFFDQQKLLSNLQVYGDLTVEGKLAIADDLAGNPFVLDALTGAVHFINFSVNPARGTKVADSFEKFLASIEIRPYE